MDENNQKPVEIPSPTQTVSLKSGLYVTATPIGNLKDMTERGKEILRRVDAIACEDTRVTAKLLSAYGIKTPTFSYHEHNAADVRPKILARLQKGEAIALVSDAGTPMISDPGYKLVAEVREAGFYVDAMPGACAVTTAIMLSGLPTDKFLFAGFLPVKEKARLDSLAQWNGLPATLVFYESPNRLLKTLKAMVDVYGAERPMAVCRELTKLHQEVVQDTISNCLDEFAARDRIRGEIVLVVTPGEKIKPDASTMDDLLRENLKTMRVKDASQLVAEQLSLPKRDVYQRALEIKEVEKSNN